MIDQINGDRSAFLPRARRSVARPCGSDFKNRRKFTYAPISDLGVLCVLRFLRFLLFQDETNIIHSLFVRADGLSGEVIGAATLVHRIMGPGLLKSVKLLNVPLGLLFNFHEVKLVDGRSRLVLPGANQPGTEGNEGNEV
jgi:hypothetical protein